MALKAESVDESFIRSRIPPRKASSHKGQNGVVCVVGGSAVYHGAPFLCSLAALRTGVDLVYVAVPKQIAQAVRALSPDLIVFPMPDTKLTSGNANRLSSWIRDVDSFALGPGLGSQTVDNLKHFIRKMEDKTRTVVLDADALRKGVLEAVTKPCILTPHTGEFERLFGVKLPEDTESRIQIVNEFSRKHAKTILLKGPVDIISDGERIAINKTHTPAMTVGGTGDVLTGICSALLAKGLSPFDAACCAAFINGKAGILASEEKGLHITASDVVSKIPLAMKDFDSIE